MGYAYIIRGTMKRKGQSGCVNHTSKLMYYIGSTTRTVKERLKEHKESVSGFTSKLENIELMWWIEVENKFVRGVELYLKRNRYLAYHLAGKRRKGSSESGKMRYRHFINWLIEHKISAIEYYKDGRIKR